MFLYPVFESELSMEYQCSIWKNLGTNLESLNIFKWQQKLIINECDCTTACIVPE